MAKSRIYLRPHVFSILLSISIFYVSGFLFNKNASCRSDEYCPGGWSVKRRDDYSAQTCVPTDPVLKKCPKPYMCIAAKCGINFCCGNDKMIARVKEQESDERDAAEADAEDRAEAEAEKVAGKDKQKEKTDQQTCSKMPPKFLDLYTKGTPNRTIRRE